MRLVSVALEEAQANFAKEAATQFAAKPQQYTYAEGDPKPGMLLAIRWNSCTVLVVMLDEEHEPSLYPVGPFIGRDLPQLEPSKW